MEKFALATRRLGHLDVAVVGRDEVTGLIAARVAKGTQTNLAFANTNLVTQASRRPEVAACMTNFLILNDGIGLTIASKLVHGEGFPDNLNGTDFTPHLLNALPKGTKVFLYGSKPHVLERAAKVLEQSCGVTIVGTQDGYTKVKPDMLNDRINDSGAQVVLVALGNPRQEEWIAANRASLKAPLCMGVGAFLDFAAGEFKRAPKWVQKLHMEWFFRLMNEPRRLAKRYTLDIGSFLWICMRESRKPVLSAMLIGLLMGLSACSTMESKPTPVVYTTPSNGMVGVNLSGAEYSGNNPNPVLNTNYIYPTEGEMRYFSSKGMAIIRLPFTWTHVQPALNGPLSDTEVRLIRQTVQLAGKYNMKVILDVHNFGGYNKMQIGTDEVPISAFVDLWSRLSKEFSNDPNIYGYGLMNEPVKLAKGVWPQAAQQAILAIRQNDTKTPILVGGEAWSSAFKWPQANPEFPLSDPNNNLIYEAHIYFDKDSSGTYQNLGAQVPDVEMVDKRLMPFFNWLKEHNARGLIGEYGVPALPQWQPVLDRALQLMHEHNVPSTYWAAGRWWGTKYTLSVEPAPGLEDRPQIYVLEKYARMPR